MVSAEVVFNEVGVGHWPYGILVRQKILRPHHGCVQDQICR